MPENESILNWIDSQQSHMEDLVTQWAAINSASDHIAGLQHMADVLTDAFSVLRHRIVRIALPPYKIITADGTFLPRPLGPALSITARPQLTNRIFLGIHFDTVYSADSPFQRAEKRDRNTLRGPGVADAKGGLAIMLIALQALEQSDHAVKIGWEVLLNPDEEIGSPGSGTLFSAAARRNRLGLLFEPALPDGSLAGGRKGSGNFVFVVHGRAAHAGRDFHSGSSAIVAMARIVLALNNLNGRWPGVTINVGRIEGGGALNVVPDLAICRVNIRCQVPPQRQEIRQELESLVSAASKEAGITAELHGEFHAPPRIFDEAHLAWFNRIADCGKELGIHIQWRSSGGTCDGNRLSAAGLPTIDTLGPIGDGIHSLSEHIDLSSLTQRAKLTALLLLKIARGDYP